jgi:hypothetical protein
MSDNSDYAFGLMLKTHLNLPRTTRRALIYMVAGEKPHVLASYHDPEDIKEWLRGDCQEPPPEREWYWRAGTRLVDWWMRGGFCGSYPDPAGHLIEKRAIKETMAEWWHFVGSRARKQWLR